MARMPFLMSSNERAAVVDALLARYAPHDSSAAAEASRALLKRLECRSCGSEGGCPSCGGCSSCGGERCGTCGEWRAIEKEQGQLLAWSEVREEVERRRLAGDRTAARAA